MFVVRAICVVALLCLAGAVEASMHLDSNDHGCADDMNTDDCFGPAVTATSGPTILACQAVGSAGQKCRMCERKLLPSGAYAGYMTCIYVTVSASCKCNHENTSECQGEGSCAYY